MSISLAKKHQSKTKCAYVHLVLLLVGFISNNLVAAPFAFVTNQGDDSVSVIDLNSLKNTETIQVGAKPANWFDNEMVVLNTKTLRIIKHIPTG
ncbi:MAG: hypothetical protein ABW158_12120, partial [Candidatus Thiodiazotropha sp. 6PDIVS]